MYEPINFESLIGIKGLSESLLRNHFTLYNGYVTNTNKLADSIFKLTIAGPEFSEMKRRFGWEFNGMRLHEYYFGSMAKNGKPLDKKSKLAKKISEDFGSYENWERDFKNTASMRGIGWVILYFDCFRQKLFNAWVNEHDSGHLAGGVPVLIIDMFEHAFMPDYGLKKADYIDAFLKIVNWKIAEERFDKSKLF